MRNEVKVGIFAVIALAILVAGIVLVGQVRFFKRGYTIYIEYNFIGDLRVGSKVQYRGGFNIGYVERVSITSNDIVRVTAVIENKDIPLFLGSTFSIYTVGMGLGEKYILVLPPATNAGPLITNNTIIRGMDPLSLESTIGSLSDISKSFTREEFVGFLKSTFEMLVNLNYIVAESKYNVTKFTHEAAAISSDLRQLTDIFVSNKGSIDETLVTTGAAVKNINTSMSNMSTVLYSLNRIIRQVEEGKGGLGKILQDEDVYLDLKKSAKNLKDLTERVRENPSLLLFSSEEKKR